MTQSDKAPKSNGQITVFTVAELPAGRERTFDITFDEAQRKEISAQLDLTSLQKMRLKGVLSPVGKSDWTIDATLGASATQACVVTLEPVKTRVDETVSRRFVANWVEPDPDSVSEMDEDVESEPLADTIDLQAIAAEALALALPDYPRKEDAVLEEAVFSEPGVKPMTDDDAKPFAGLAALKEKLEK